MLTVTEHNAPARAYGNKQPCLVVFECAPNGDLLDILHYCDDCGAWRTDTAYASYWPVFFSDAQATVCCATCGLIIHEIVE